jgi:ribosomal protein S18
MEKNNNQADALQSSTNKEKNNQYNKIDYKNLDLIKRYTSERGKILPRRLTNATAKEQREIAQAVKRARFLSLIAPLVR